MPRAVPSRRPRDRAPGRRGCDTKCHQRDARMCAESEPRRSRGSRGMTRPRRGRTPPRSASPDPPNSVFVEDTVFMYADLAVITRPGPDERKPETAVIEQTLRERGYRIAHLEAPGTLRTARAGQPPVGRVDLRRPPAPDGARTRPGQLAHEVVGTITPIALTCLHSARARCRGFILCSQLTVDALTYLLDRRGSRPERRRHAVRVDLAWARRHRCLLIPGGFRVRRMCHVLRRWLCTR
jgi:hypothetical protein